MRKIRVILADDHTFLRIGVRAVLSQIEDFEVIAEACDGKEAMSLVEKHRPDVLLSDIAMPSPDGLELASWIAHEFPKTRVLILSMHKEKEFATRAVANGAAGYLIKEGASYELETAIRAVSRGEVYLSATITAHIVADYVRLSETQLSDSSPLTERQHEVLLLITEGMPTKLIARRLDISVKTVETHRSQLMERLGIRDVAGLVRYAIRMGYIAVEP